jgi:hypothetical protein
MGSSLHGQPTSPRALGGAGRADAFGKSGRDGDRLGAMSMELGNSLLDWTDKFMARIENAKQIDIEQGYFIRRTALVVDRIVAELSSYQETFEII